MPEDWNDLCDIGLGLDTSVWIHSNLIQIDINLQNNM